MQVNNDLGKKPEKIKASTGFEPVISLTPHGRYELSKLTLLPMCGFIARLVEHHTSIAEVTVSNPVGALIFFRLLLSSCLSWKIYCDDHVGAIRSSSKSLLVVVQNY